jgi:hypothetical protein
MTGVHFPAGAMTGYFLPTTVLGPAPIQWVLWIFTTMQSGRDVKLNTLSSNAQDNAWNLPPFLQNFFMAMCLIKEGYLYHCT